MNRSAPGTPRTQSAGGLRAWIAAACDAGEAVRFSRRTWWAIGALIAILLLPSLLHPLGPDQALFYMSGRKILHGAVLYRDIVDIKPALIYHLYALAEALFGGGVLAVRILDVLVQGAACWLMVGTIRRSRGGDLVAALAPVCYLFLYFGQGYQYTAQSEAYMGLFGLLAMRLFLFGRSPRGYFAIGLAVGALFLVKFTFGVLLVAVLVAEPMTFGRLQPEFLRRSLAMAAGFGCVVAAFIVYLVAGHAVHDFALVSQFTSAYAAIEFRSPAQWFKNLITIPTLHFTDNYSIVLMLASVAGAALSLGPARAADRETGSVGFTHTLRFCAIAFVLLFITIVIEAKYPPYHFMRLYPFGAILAAAGIAGVGRAVAAGNIAKRYTWTLLPVMLAVLILFGPFLRYGWHALMPAREALRHVTPAQSAQTEPYSREEFAALGSAIRATSRPNGKLFVMSSQAALVYLEAGVVPELKIFHSAFVIAPFAANEWRDTVDAWLLRERPGVVVLDEGDALPGITGTDRTSSMAIRALPGVGAMLDAEYSRDTLTAPMFGLYVRREDR